MPRKAKRPKPVQMYDDTWYLDKFDKHECCDCGLVHRVKYGVERGRIFTNWTRDDKETEQTRREHGIKVTKP